MLISRFENTDIERHILEFENKYAFKFPVEYREMLQRYNGGDTPDTTFKINKISSDLEGFFGLGDAEVFLNYSSLEKSSWLSLFLKDGFIPIGTNVFGDYVLIGIAEKNEGKVFFYFHDRGKRYIELTSDFKSFVKQCKSQKIGHVRSIEERRNGMISNGLGDKITIQKIAAWQAEIDKYGNIKQEELVL